MEQNLYSIRMRSSTRGKHISGAERIVSEAALEEAAAGLVRRALQHSRGRAENIRLSMDFLEPAQIHTGALPDLSTVVVQDYLDGREAAACFLEQAGVSRQAVERTIKALSEGAAPGGESMRGAMLVDAQSGERLEVDSARGVRASRMDLTSEAEKRLREGLKALGLDNPHVREALVLAAKVLAAPGVVAELCWSDDPDYVAGYVATPQIGYRRLTRLKPSGELRGGRAFFLQPGMRDLQPLTEWLEKEVLLLTEVGKLSGEVNWKDMK